MPLYSPTLLTSPSVTGNMTVAGVTTANGGVSTAGSAPVLTPAFSSGVAAQLADTTRDYLVYLEVGTAGTAMSVGIGPTSGAANAVSTSGVATTGQIISFRLPAGWFVKWTAVTATLSNQLAIGC
jgi:hypothetical protein